MDAVPRNLPSHTASTLHYLCVISSDFPNLPLTREESASRASPTLGAPGILSINSRNDNAGFDPSMGFKFTFLCDLLSALEQNKILKASTQARRTNPDDRVVNQWFAQHGNQFRDRGTDQLALLSCMFPEKRTDRVYWLQDISLARVVGRCLLLGSSRREELEKWRISGGEDLGRCVENVMRQAENHIPRGQEVTVEEIDSAMNRIASRCRFSGPQIRRQRTAVDVEQTLAPLYRRLSSRDAKWLTRMILKSYLSVTLPEKLTLKSFHFLLPHLLLFQDSFEVALNLLKSDPISNFPPQPEPGLARDLGLIALQHLTPNIGVKIGRPDYYKARSIKHCCQMANRRRMSLERKYDGEYCQIHIDISKHPISIKIFSKSGKDSTQDRSAVHQAIKDSLKIGTPSCRFLRHCILEGELVVWSDKHNKIMPFHKLRKFVSRSGTFIGIDNDSPPQPYEHLMIIFFDILLLDDDICLRKPHRERRLLLKDTVHAISGRADLAYQQIIDFSRPNSQEQLEGLFAKGVVERWEGFVLKGCEDPYFTIIHGTGEGSAGRWIKLKKDYIPGLGDTIDLALIGGAYNSRDAATLGIIKKVSWTHFFIGCLTNKEAVIQSKVQPKFLVVDVIDRHCMSERILQNINQIGSYSACSMDSSHGFYIEYGRANLPAIDVVFKSPFVVELLGSGFEKPSGCRYYTLRFPRILKIHYDRSFEDAVSFAELQLLAGDAISVPHEEMLEQQQEWTQRVRSSISRPHYIVQSQSLSSTLGSTYVSQPSMDKNISTEHGLFPSPSQTGPTRDFQPSDLDYQLLPYHKASRNGIAKAVPVYVDESAPQSPSDDISDLQATHLTNNANLSFCKIKRKRKAPHSTSEPCGDSTTTKASQSTSTAKANRLTPIKSRPSLRTKAGPVNRKALLTRPWNIKDIKQAESPLKTLPIYIAFTPSASADRTLTMMSALPKATQTLAEFIHILVSEETRASDKEPWRRSNQGIVFINISKNPLAATLLNLTTHISAALRASKYSPAGRVFVLDSELLNIIQNRNHSIDPAFSLRKTWENIGKELFYACIVWDSRVVSGMGLSGVDELPGTPVNGGKAAHHSREIPKRRPPPKIQISFDRKTLLVLGQG